MACPFDWRTQKLLRAPSWAVLTMNDLRGVDVGEKTDAQCSLAHADRRRQKMSDLPARPRSAE